MTAAPPGPLLARGRDADVFALDERTVLRRYRRRDVPEGEVRVMRFAHEQGYPLPALLEHRGPDLVLERADGPTMAEDLARRPWRMGRHAALLADLHDRLHRIVAPPELPARLGSGTALLHYDLHPANVILTRRGPLVIDWANAARGEPAEDVAMTWVILATSVIDRPNPVALPLRALRRSYLARFLERFDLSAVRRVLPAVADLRLRDANVRDDERAAVRRLVAREGKRS